VQQVIDTRMRVVARPKDGGGLRHKVWTPRLVNPECPEHDSFGVSQSEAASSLRGGNYISGQVKRYRDRPQR
jgi:hypothetical protein